MFTAFFVFGRDGKVTVEMNKAEVLAVTFVRTL
jgi:hypothetical protein